MHAISSYRGNRSTNTNKAIIFGFGNVVVLKHSVFLVFMYFTPC